MTEGQGFPIGETPAFLTEIGSFEGIFIKGINGENCLWT